LLAGMTRAEKAQLLRQLLSELGEELPGVESRPGGRGRRRLHRSNAHSGTAA